MQAIQNLNYAQKSYAAMWNENLTKDKVDIFAMYNIGVLKVYENELEEVSKPRRNYFGYTPFLQKIIQTQRKNKKEQFLWSDLI